MAHSHPESESFESPSSSRTSSGGALSLALLLGVIAGIVCMAGWIDPEPVVSTAPAERLVERENFNSDGSVSIGGQTLWLTGRPSKDYAAIHRMASERGDSELASAAALALVCLAIPEKQDIGWQLLGDSIIGADTGLAVNLAQRRLEFVGWLEAQLGRGLQIGSSIWQGACTRRANDIAVRGLQRYQAACGWITDDEEEIAVSLVELREAYDLLAPSGMTGGQAVRLRDAIGAAEAELWASHAQSTNGAYESQVGHGEHRLRSVMLRLSMAIQEAQRQSAEERTTTASR